MASSGTDKAASSASSKRAMCRDTSGHFSRQVTRAMVTLTTASDEVMHWIFRFSQSAPLQPLCRSHGNSDSGGLLIVFQKLTLLRLRKWGDL